MNTWNVSEERIHEHFHFSYYINMHIAISDLPTLPSAKRDQATRCPQGQSAEKA